MLLACYSKNLSCPYLPNDNHTCTNSFHNSNFTVSHAKVNEAFHRTVGGRMFRHEKIRNKNNMTCQFILESKIGLWPSLTAPKSSKQSMDSYITCLTKFAKNRQLEHQNTTMESQNSKEGGTYL